MSAPRRAAVIGHPVAHSKSPALFARFAEASGVALTYVAVDVKPEQLAPTLARWRADAVFVGCNVTLPHKERALELADVVEPAARACGAANVLTRVGETLVADNTDVIGIEAALKQRGIALRGARVAILGAGGAARAVAEAARRSGAASIVVAARKLPKAQAVARDFGATACDLDEVPRATIYVNATPVGMQGQPQRSLLPRDAPAGATAFDLVYVPEQTPFLLDAKMRGLRTVSGTAMFRAQAIATFERWFGFAPKEQLV
ncbi:MAG: shikimate dehydrogenase [Candidatus Eremiobacteraeota bacterium]|nr:shikimate dehydrogenase [Candidatus Eremiobacteraeota bacterium]